MDRNCLIKHNNYSMQPRDVGIISKPKCPLPNRGLVLVYRRNLSELHR